MSLLRNTFQAAIIIRVNHPKLVVKCLNFKKMFVGDKIIGNGLVYDFVALFEQVS